MAAPESYRADIPAEVNNFYDRTLLAQALPLNIHGLFGQKTNLPQKAGTKVVKFRRYGVLAAAGALTEGTTPTGKSFSVTDITATALQYGDFTKFSDEVLTQGIDSHITVASKEFGDQMGLTFDELGRDVIVAGSTVQYASTATSRVTVAAGMTLDAAEIKEAVRTLKIAKAKKLNAISGSSPGVGTVPVNSTFVGITHPAGGYDLKAATGWNSVEKYAGNVTLMPGEIGSLDEVRFVETTNAKIWTGAGAAAIDVYGTMILGSDAYGVIDLGGSQASGMIVKALGSAGTADPLNQRSTAGWKAYYVAKILNDAFMVRIEHAVS
jgi:N4-gp56 family major capsid protein